ncbi:MAG: hypothetical protein ABW199_00165 [Caulobacterales bacterium]
MIEYNSVQRTRTSARIVGPYMLISGLALFLRRDEAATLFGAFLSDDGLTFATGAFTVMAGLTLLTFHRHWSSVTAAIITIVGVMATLKGASLMAAPELGADMTIALLREPILLTLGALLDVALGAWLTFIGWFKGRAGNTE